MEEAIKNLMMHRAMQGGGAPTGGSMPMAPGGGVPQVNPALLKAVMASRAGGGKGAPATRGKVAPAKAKAVAKGKAAPKGKMPAKGGKGKPVPKKAER